MKTQEHFVSLDEQAVETVSGGNILNESLNGNMVSVLTDFSVFVSTDNVLSNILTVMSGQQVTKTIGGEAAED